MERMTEQDPETGFPCIIRPIVGDETALLKEFLYEAIFIPEGVEPPAREVVELPELRVYTENFGTQKGDYCLVAETDGKAVGAVWTRIMDDYGHVDNETPSLAISLYREYRGQGVGSQLLTEMLALLRQQGYRKVSLSVQKENAAVRLYRRVGFEIAGETEQEYLMVCTL